MRFSPDGKEGKKLNGPTSETKQLLHVPSSTWADEALSCSEQNIYRFSFSSADGRHTTHWSDVQKQIVACASNKVGEKFSGPCQVIAHLLRVSPNLGRCGIVSWLKRREVLRFEPGSMTAHWTNNEHFQIAACARARVGRRRTLWRRRVMPSSMLVVRSFYAPFLATKSARSSAGLVRPINQLLNVQGPAWGDIVLSGGDSGELFRFLPDSPKGQKLSF